MMVHLSLCILQCMMTTVTYIGAIENEQHQQYNNETTTQLLRNRQLVDASRKDLPYPDFFVLGAMKCGTTSLNKLMKKHPEICAEGKKEKHFFDSNGYDSDDGYRLYLREFQKCKEGQFTLDSTPAYIRNAYVPRRVKESFTSENLKKKKFMLILREPIARHYSEYQMRIRVCLDYGDLADIGKTSADDDKNGSQQRVADDRGAESCEKVTKNYMPGISMKKLQIMNFAEWTISEDGDEELHRGHYVDHVKGWTCDGCTIERKQLFIMNFDSLIKQSGDVLGRLGKFLGLQKPWDDDTTLPEVHKKKPKTVLDCQTYDYLSNYFVKKNVGLIELINDAHDKPVDEPPFPAFRSNRSVCVDL